MHLRAVTITDAAFLYELLRQRPDYANISHKSMPSWDEHAKFVTGKPYKAWYLLFHNNKPVGSIYLTDKDEIGLQISIDQQHKGFAQEALHELLELHPSTRYLANIAPSNLPSQEFFERQGFKEIQRTYELEQPVRAARS